MIEAWWAWLRRWRPCVPPVIHQGRTIEQWCDICQQQSVELAAFQRAVEDRDRTIDRLTLRIEQLEDLIRDMCELRKRVGV